MRFIVLAANLTINTVNESPSLVEAAKAAWENFVAKAVLTMPTPLQSVFITTPESQSFAWASAQQVCYQEGQEIERENSKESHFPFLFIHICGILLFTLPA